MLIFLLQQNEPPQPDDFEDVDVNEPELTNNEVQIAKYLNELLSHGIRYYATGFLLENTKLSLWYADRCGIVKSRYFDFILEPHYFLLMVAALYKASPADLGFCTLISDMPTDFLSHDGAILTLPHAQNVYGKSIGEETHFDLNIGDSKLLDVRYGTVGRGTTIIPVHPSGETLNPRGKQDFDLVVKLSWQHTKRDEVGKVRKIRTTFAEALNIPFFGREVRSALKYIVDLKCSVSLSLKDVGLPRAFMPGLSDIAPEDGRYLSVLVMKEYIPLWRIDNPGELKIIFRHALTGTLSYILLTSIACG